MNQTNRCHLPLTRTRLAAYSTFLCLQGLAFGCDASHFGACEEQCAAGTICLDGHCAPVCNRNADCASGMQCMQGACVAATGVSCTHDVACSTSPAPQCNAANDAWVTYEEGACVSNTCVYPVASTHPCPDCSLHCWACEAAECPATRPCGVDGACNSALNLCEYTSVADGSSCQLSGEPEGLGQCQAGVCIVDAPPCEGVGCPLQTTITADPGGESGVVATFTFTASIEGSTFECQLAPQESEFTPCTSPKTYSELTEIAAPGYTFYVRAVADGMVDPTPASHTFTVDATGPGVVISGAPAASAVVHTTSASFAFTAIPSDEPAPQFFCGVNVEPTIECTDGFALQGLYEGTYQLRVKAVDHFGNEGAEVLHSWSITPLETTIYNIRTAPVEDGTRVQIQQGAGDSAVRITLIGLDRYWVQETDGVASPDFKGLTVYPMDNPPFGLTHRNPVLIGTVTRVGNNTAIRDTTHAFPNETSFDTYPRSTDADSSELLKLENQGLLVSTAGTYYQSPGTCAEGVETRLQTCWNSTVDICLDQQYSTADLRNGDVHGFAGIPMQTPSGLRFIVMDANYSSDACML